MNGVLVIADLALGHPMDRYIDCIIFCSLHGLVDLSVAVAGLEAVPRYHDEDAARLGHLVPYVVMHSLPQVKVSPMPADPEKNVITVGVVI